jgi:hypothetical protein
VDALRRLFPGAPVAARRRSLEADDIYFRYCAVAQQARGSFSALEATERDQKVLFRRGKGCAWAAGIFAVGLICFLCIVFLIGPALSWLPAPLSWVVAAGVLIVLMRMVVRMPAVTCVQPVFFEVDCRKRQIYVHPVRGNSQMDRIDLDDVRFFLGCWWNTSEGADGVVYAGMEDGELKSLTPDLGSFARLEINVRVLGFICSKLAYVSHVPDDSTGFIGPREGGGLQVTAEDRLQRVATTLYVPGESLG